jgi:hypothetical protein
MSIRPTEQSSYWTEHVEKSDIVFTRCVCVHREIKTANSDYCSEFINRLAFVIEARRVYCELGYVNLTH